MSRRGNRPQEDDAGLADEADLLEQRRPTTDDVEDGSPDDSAPVGLGQEVDEADALEQNRPVSDDDDGYDRTVDGDD